MLYMTEYPDVSISVDKSDPAAAISRKQTYELPPIETADETFSSCLEVIEWKRQTARMLYRL